MGRVLATKMCVVLEYSSQGANGVKENRPLLVSILPHLIQSLGRCLSATQDDPGSRLQILPAAFWPSSPEGSWTGEGSGDVKSQRSLRK